jgi:4-hydroxy-3-methylbut-2-en-1-yl diphosphate reductase
MNRLVVREFQAPGISVPRGEVLVPTEVGDPARGPLRCPAAMLIAGSLVRRGWPAALAPVPRLDDAGGDAGGAAVYLATCSQRDGSTAALAAATAPQDRRAAAAASAVVQEWAAVAGTRRLLMASRPWCGGARRALEAARRTASDQAGRGRGVHIYGDLAAPPEATAELAARGVRPAADLAAVPAGDIVIFPAHGVPPAVRAQAATRGLSVLDATCPLVAGVQDQAARVAQRGDELVLIGNGSYPVAAAIAGCAPGRATVVETVAGTARLAGDARRVSYLLQPGLPVEACEPVAAALRSRFPAVHGPHPDGFCYAASDRAQTIRAIAADCDLMLVLGDADSADARQVAALARDGGVRPQVIGSVADITPVMLTGVSSVGLAESTSAGSALAGEVIAALGGLGPLSVVGRQVSSQITGAGPADDPLAAGRDPAGRATAGAGA